jgi:endosialidase-like protein
MRDQGHSTWGTVVGIIVGMGWLLGAPAAALAAGGESAFVGLTPCRLADTRGNGFGDPFGLPALVTGVPRDFPLQGQCGIPAAALAVSLNVTATNTRGPGFLLLYPQGGAQPVVSTLNYVAGQTVANAAIVPLGPGGLTVVAGVAGADLILDVNGYFEDVLVHDVGADNIFVGLDAGDPGTTGQGNTAVGARALNVNTTASSNTAVGRDALRFNTGGGNTGIGNNALGNNTTGSSNIAIGSGAGSNLSTGDNNIMIGNAGGVGESNTIRIGSSQTQVFISGIATTNVGPIPAPVLITGSGLLGVNLSTARVKEAIEPMGEASRRLQQLRPVTFRYRQAAADGTKPRQYGLIAEEVAEVYADLVASDADGQPERVLYHVLPALLLNELQRQERVIETQAAELAALRRDQAALQAEVARLAAALADNARVEATSPAARP